MSYYIKTIRSGKNKGQEVVAEFTAKIKFHPYSDEEVYDTKEQAQRIIDRKIELSKYFASLSDDQFLEELGKAVELEYPTIGA